MKIGDNIREIREKEKGLKKEDLAKALGLTTKAYSNIENNVSDITLTRLFEISEVLGCTPEHILNYQEKATYNNHFNNYDGNHGTIIMYQGGSAEQVKNLEEQLKNSRDKLKDLQQVIKKSRDN
jgi:transcriptional regulator with XRE-family HTH domain